MTRGNISHGKGRGSWTPATRVGVVSLFVVVAGIGALAASPADGESTLVAGDTIVSSGAPATSGTTPIASPAPQEFSGSGSTVTDRFRLEGGFFVAEYRHTGGTSNFVVTMIDPNGTERDRLLANEIGGVAGVYGEGIAEGEYLMDVDADGDWTIVVRQPRVEEGGGEELPLQVSGNASDGYVAVNVEGIAVVHATHEGEGNFVVESFTRDGDRHLDTLIFNEIGTFEGAATLQYEGTTWIVIRADGPWTLRLEPA